MNNDMQKYIEELKIYQPKLTRKPDDFKVFWKKQKAKINQLEPSVMLSWRDYPSPSVEVADITFNSWDETPLTGIFVKPKGKTNCPVIINYPGYTGSCGYAIDYLKWTSLGIAVYSFDIRGQGTSPDYAKYKNGSSILGWLLQSILDPATYYYTNVYKDILFQLNWIKSEDAPIHARKLALAGGSQGGGLALGAASLTEDIEFIIASYPFMSHIEHAVKIAKTGAYQEISNYFRMHDPEYQTYEQVMKTLSYVDTVNFCEDITCPVLMASGLKDQSTSPPTVFAAYNHIQSAEKQIEIYPQFAHEAVPIHEEKKLAFIAKHFKV